MSELPNGWEIIPLPDCVYFQEGPGLRKWQFGESGIPFLNIRTFNNGIIDKTKCQFVKLEEFEGKYEHFLLNDGDIVVSSSGTLGKLAVIKESDLPLMLNTSVIRYRTLYSDLLFQSYLKLFLQTHHFFQQIESAKTGSAISNYGPSHLKEMKIIVAPVNEQRRIVAKLETLLGKVDACQQRLAKLPRLLKRFRQAVLAAACSGRLTADWRGKNNESEDLPEGWKLVTLESLLPKGGIFDGPFGSNLKTSDYADSGVRVIRLENIGHLHFIAEKETYISREKYETLAKHTVGQGDIIFSSFIADEIRVCMLPELETKAIAKADCFCLRPIDELVNRGYLTLQLASWDTYSFLVENVHGATRPRINTTQLRNLEIKLCPLPEQHEIVRRVEAFFHLADQLVARYHKAKAHVDKLTQSLLAKAFRGKLVPQDPQDEPAAVLLERIRAEHATQSKPSPKPTRRLAKPN